MPPEREATSLPKLGVDIGYISPDRNGADVNRLYDTYCLDRLLACEVRIKYLLRRCSS